jgi:hypothetical protein
MTVNTEHMRELGKLSAFHRPGPGNGCEGCVGHPWPGCACCGGPTAYLALAGKDAISRRHVVTYCVRCWERLLACRREDREERKRPPLVWWRAGEDGPESAEKVS